MNHHLLFADIAYRKETNNYSQNAVLPYLERLIIDEAHHIEDVATEYFAEKIHFRELYKILNVLSFDKAEKKIGKFFIL